MPRLRRLQTQLKETVREEAELKYHTECREEKM